ncbi:MAG: HisA/HisF-related TIM barrel protein [Methanophagales archaeon]|nr:HisA/HisF-related TIM barrel protein [Methanophagales archaeon]
MNFRLIFVMDLLDGVVVHAKKGEREKYQPIHLFSSIINTSDPVQVIEEIKPVEVYIADLNRVMNTGSNKDIIKEIRNKNRKTRIMIEYGIRGLYDLKEAAEAEIADNIVLGTETASMDLLARASKSDISGDISVSIDLFNKEVLTNDMKMKLDPLLLIKALNEYPIRDVIVLELDRVGTKSGIDFDFLARAVEFSEHNILCGGGVRSSEDVRKIEEIGVKGALVATAVHDMAIPLFLLRL